MTNGKGKSSETLNLAFFRLNIIKSLIVLNSVMDVQFSSFKLIFDSARIFVRTLYYVKIDFRKQLLVSILKYLTNY